MLDTTSNGIRYDWNLAGMRGASFIIYKDNHTEIEVKKAIREIRHENNVVSLRQANAVEIVEQFIKDVIEITMGKGLTFLQIRYDAKELLLAINMKSTPEEYVKKNFKKWSKNISFEL